MTESPTTAPRLGDLVGVIRHRLLINRWVDPDEVVAHLPVGVRPRLGSGGGVIVGCCLIAIENARPWPLPAAIGPTVYAAAHRISVEVGPPDAGTAAVYVPMRHSNSRPTVAIGGRLFPGVHRRAETTVDHSDNMLSWEVRPTGSKRRPDSADNGFGIAATAKRTSAKPARSQPALSKAALSGVTVSKAALPEVAVSEVADIVIGTVLGISPDHQGRLEGAEMWPTSTLAHEAELIDLRSEFLEGFHSAQDAETLLMTDVGVTWRRAPVPLSTNSDGSHQVGRHPKTD